MERVNLDKGGQGWLIDPKELRIGNILEYENDLVHVTSLSLDIDDEYQELIGFCKLGKDTDETVDWNRALCARLKPVPLTPVILRKCGFDGDDSWNDFHFGEFRVAYHIHVHYINFKTFSSHSQVKSYR